MDSPDAIRALATRGVAGVLVPNVVDAVAVAEGRRAGTARNSKKQQGTTVRNKTDNILVFFKSWEHK